MDSLWQTAGATWHVPSEERQQQEDLFSGHSLGTGNSHLVCSVLQLPILGL